MVRGTDGLQHGEPNATSPTGTCSNAVRVVTCNLETLTAADRATVRIVATATTQGTRTTQRL